jgi:hypothetical protein
VVLTQENHMTVNRPAKMPTPAQVMFLSSAAASSATTST